jgi:hypothetical protein
MRTMLAGFVVLVALIVCLNASGPAIAGDQFSAPDARANFVYRPWGTRYTYRWTGWDWHRTWSLGPRNHFRLRRDWVDLQLRDRWQPHVEAYKEPMK